MTDATRPLEFRTLRRADVPAYLPVILLGVGNLERSTGLDRGSESTLRMLSRRSVWWILAFLRAVGRPAVDIFVAADGERLVGTGTILWLPSAGYVAGMATRPEYRGRGIASRILALQRAAVARRGKAWIALDVESENSVAVRVYERAGYREAARFSWFARPGLPGDGALTPEVAPATRAEVAEVIGGLDAARSPEYRAALPASARMLSHIQILVSGRRVQHRTWVVSTASGSPFVVRAACDVNAQLGAYFLLPGRSVPTSEEVERALTPATAWLRGLAPTRSFAVVPEPVGQVGPALEKFGFRFAVASLTMVRPSAETRPPSVGASTGGGTDRGR